MIAAARARSARSRCPMMILNMAGLRGGDRPQGPRPGVGQRAGLCQRHLRAARGPPADPVGEADVVIAGGTDAGITPTMLAGLSKMGPLSERNDEPERASRPFDADRDGFVFGEGAVVMVVESAEHARARGARIYGSLAGGALTSDAFHMSAPEPSGSPRRPRHRAGAGAQPAPARRAGLHLRSRHRHPRQRHRRDQGHQAGPGRGRRAGPGQLAQIDGRAPDRRRRWPVGDGLPPGHA